MAVHVWGIQGPRSLPYVSLHSLSPFWSTRVCVEHGHGSGADQPPRRPLRPGRVRLPRPPGTLPEGVKHHDP